MKTAQLQAKINVALKILTEVSSELINFSTPPVQPESKPIKINLPEEMLSAKEVQRIMKISQSTFYGWIKCGVIPPGQEWGKKVKRWKRSVIESVREN